MGAPIEFFRWWITDERTGKRRRTTYKLTRSDAKRAFLGAEPEEDSRRIRHLLEPGTPPSSRPGGDAS